MDAGAVSVGPDACEVFRIANGWAREGRRLRRADAGNRDPVARARCPQQQGCYLGQEVMERIAAAAT